MVDSKMERIQRLEVLRKFYEDSGADPTYPVDTQSIARDLGLDLVELAKFMQYLRGKGFIDFKGNPYAQAKITSTGIDEFESSKTYSDKFSLKKRDIDQIQLSPVFGIPQESLKSSWADIFMIMPFQDALEPVYRDHILEVTDGLELTCERGDDFYSGQEIIKEIWAAI